MVDGEVVEESLATEARGREAGTEGGSARLFRLNACLWWAAASLEEAIEGAAREYGIEAAELLDEHHPPSEVSALAMMSLVIQVDGETRTFWVELQRRLETGEKMPMEFGRTSG